MRPEIPAEIYNHVLDRVQEDHVSAGEVERRAWRLVLALAEDAFEQLMQLDFEVFDDRVAEILEKYDANNG